MARHSQCRQWPRYICCSKLVTHCPLNIKTKPSHFDLNSAVFCVFTSSWSNLILQHPRRAFIDKTYAMNGPYCPSDRWIEARPHYHHRDLPYKKKRAAPALTACVSSILGQHVEKCHASRTQFHTSSDGNVKVESPSVCDSPFSSSSPPSPHPPLTIVRPHALYQFLGKTRCSNISVTYPGIMTAKWKQTQWLLSPVT